VEAFTKDQLLAFLLVLGLVRPIPIIGILTKKDLCDFYNLLT